MPTRLLAAFTLLLSTLGALTLQTLPAAATTVPTCAGLELTQPPLLAPGTLIGTSGPDILLGSPGDDVIKGGGDDDVICGGFGSDRIEGGAGDDLLYGEYGYNAAPCPEGFGDDLIFGGSGDDYASDSCGNNTVHGDSGRDYLDAISGTADGGSGNDLEVSAMNGYYTCFGGDENCVIGHARGGSGDDRVQIVGGDADGGSGRDTVNGYHHGDVLRGGSSVDTLTDMGFLGTMTLDGGAGSDTCFAATTDVVKRCEVVA